MNSFLGIACKHNKISFHALIQNTLEWHYNSYSSFFKLVKSYLLKLRIFEDLKQYLMHYKHTYMLMGFKIASKFATLQPH